MKNSKSMAWDIIGERFWNMGTPSLEERKTELDFYFEGLYNSVAILGASSDFMISEAIKKDINISVLDFSSQLLDAIRSKYKNATNVDTKFVDLTSRKLIKKTKYDRIIADRLVNRFSIKEAEQFFTNVLNMLNDNGELRTIIRLGMYPIDKKLLQVSEKQKTASKFWKSDQMTIDFKLAKNELNLVIESMDGVKKSDIVDWYYYRGEEQRFNMSIIKRLITKQIDTINKPSFKSIHFGDIELLFLTLKKKRLG